jgi:mannose-6-phosphate isomerase-like protein (cupin superfamily)
VHPDAPTYVLHKGERVTVRERSEGLLALEAEWDPEETRPPLHLHPHQDERFEVLEGELTVQLKGKTRVLSAGETLEVPRRTAHRMWNASEQPARARWEVRPALRTEEMFAAIDRSRAFASQPKTGGMTLLGAAPVLSEFSDEFRLTAPSLIMKPVMAMLSLVARRRGYPTPANG